ncbi:hypothetical protein KIH27_06215 [Mycobacterium sp. M1]|uniref:DUF6779 domain-containing protein n=1 Tax=Mycolicibacter acidiphilus TaxID=2835306 RepID=A0ABS5RFX0_9MYCO|nr:DUF6779 domain-containing protein [Mycolicibacter acidiphilus]MBS9533185.1 hypothetical protein [Mycolicibacter acidiphilus]
MTSVLSRGRTPRGVRRPGWALLTALLVLAIAASSALVFTSRVELLKLAVIMALWAAVVAAFVSVIYRRQSDVDQARARDLKLVYDLQLDREISARREYELTVESQLRRELASELRAQAADEVAALRTELAALRANLEILFDADLSDRPALEQERTTVRAYSDWARNESTTETRVTPAVSSKYTPDRAGETAENPIIDVPEVRIPTPPPPPPPPPPAPPTAPGRGSHRRAADEEPAQPDAGRWAGPAQPYVAPEPRREPAPPPPPPPPLPVPPVPPPPQLVEPAASSGAAWKPVGAEGEWLPPGTPGSNWTPSQPERTGHHRSESAPTPPPPPPPPVVEPPAPSRHRRRADEAEAFSGPAPGWEPPPAPPQPEPAQPYRGGRRRAESRHAADAVEQSAGGPVGRHAGPPPVAPAPPVEVPAPSASRHSNGAESETDTGGQSVADLLARLQPEPGSGGRRRRAE